MTLQELKSNAVKVLSSTSPSPQLDVEVLIHHFFGLNKTNQLLHRSEEVSPSAVQNFNSAIQTRSKGLPVAYITGHKEFFGYDFLVTPSVLIPKPDTEILVENAIQLIKEKIDLNQNKILTVCDMCTGSGCIGLSVLKALYENEDVSIEQLPKFTLADISSNALEIARQNTESLFSNTPELMQRVRLIQTNLFEMLPQTFDVILTNPPYIPAKMVDNLLKDGRSEPRLALDGDITITGDKSQNTDGLEIIRNLLPQMYRHLTTGGNFFMETGEYNMEAANKLAASHNFKNLEIINDLSGQMRVLSGQKESLLDF